MGTVDGNSQTRCTGQRSGNQTDNTWCIDIKCIFQPDCGKTSGTNNKHSDEDKCLSFTAERVKEAGTCLNSDGKNEEHQTEVS